MNKLRLITIGLLGLSLLLFSSFTLSAQWSQLGLDIDGEAINDRSGTSVSLSADGSHLAVGAPLNADNGFFSGHVKVYKWSGSAWTQLGSNINGDAPVNKLGWSVSLSADGSRLAVGAPNNNNINGNSSGQVKVYDWSGIAWIQVGSNINGEAAYDESGGSVSLSADGSRLAVGARGNNGVNGSYSGHVRVYDLVGTAWVQQGADIDGEAAGDNLGSSVSLSDDGSRLAVGAPGNGGNGSYSGHVRVYDLVGTAWVQQGADIDGEAAFNFSGRSVSLSADGSRLAVGADGNNGVNGSYSGHVRVYDLVGTAWVQQGADIDGEAAGDNLGSSVSLSDDGSRLSVGAAYSSANGSGSGQVKVYDLVGTAWVQQGADINGEAIGDLAGRSVSLSADGSRLAVGAPNNNGTNGIFSGHVRVYEGFIPPAVTNRDSNGDGIPDITDPCACTDPLNVVVLNGPSAPNGDLLFHEVVNITSASAETWDMINLNSGQVYDASGNPLILPINVPEIGATGVYQIEFYHHASVGYDANFSNGVIAIPLNQANSCTICPTSVPTMSEWGLMAFILVLSSLGMAALVRRRKTAIA